MILIITPSSPILSDAAILNDIAETLTETETKLRSGEINSLPSFISGAFTEIEIQP